MIGQGTASLSIFGKFKSYFQFGVLLAACLFCIQTFAASVSVNPSSGPGNSLLTAIAAGFQPDVSGTVYANSGFYVDDGFMTGCTNMDGASWANCTVLFRGPTTVGPHIIRASNSFGESATTTFTVNAPTLDIAPAFGPVGTHVSINGQTFVAAGNVGVFVDDGFTQNEVTDESGGFADAFTFPALADGAHEIKGQAGGASAAATFTVTNCIGSLVMSGPGGRLTPVGGSPQPLPPGMPVPVQMGDAINSGTGGNVPLNLIDGTSIKAAANSRLAVDAYTYDPNDNTDNSAHYNFLAGAFQYVSGLIGKKPDPQIDINTPIGELGIRGTQLIARRDACSTTQEVYLIEGRITVTPQATHSVTNTYDAPISLFITSNTITTNALTQAMYDSISNQVFQASATVTFGSWLEQYFGCTNNNTAAEPLADPDGDGQNNLTEFLTGTDPTSAASYFHLVSTKIEENDFRVWWLCGGGRTNVLQSTSNLGGSWANVSPHIVLSGYGGVMTNYLDLGSITNGSAHFYRVQLIQ
jgi:hypothetical protein